MSTANPVTKQARWRKVLVTCFVMTFFCGGWYVAALGYVWARDTSSSVNSGPRLFVPTTRYDFGNVTAGPILRHMFAVRNDGATRVVLNRVSCGCCGSDEDAAPIILGPGTEKTIPMELHTAGKAGTLRRVLQITTSDPTLPRILFTMTAHIKRVEVSGE